MKNYNRFIYDKLGGLIMLLCSLQYKYHDKDIFYIRGFGEHQGRYLLYTEKNNIADRMHKF